MDNYSILGLKKGATLVEIKAQFRCLSKQLHPDVNGGDKGKTDRFLAVSEAYKALLEGDIKKNKKEYYKNTSNEVPKTAKYSFEGIKKDKIGYIITFKVDNVYSIEIYGKNLNYIGYYNVYEKIGFIQLRILFKEAKEADYVLTCFLKDEKGNSAKVTYKIKKPSFLETLIDKIFQL